MINTKTATHPKEADLAGFLDGSLTAASKKRVEEHLAECDECLSAVVSSYEAVKLFNKATGGKIWRGNLMKKINIYLVLSIISFTLSFITPRYFLQLLVATLILGTKWIVDAKTTKMLVMIYEAWKHGGEKEASRILKKFESGDKNRL